MTDAPFTLTDRRFTVHEGLGTPLLLASEALEPLQQWMMALDVDPNDVALPGFIEVSEWGAVTFEAYVRESPTVIRQDPAIGKAMREIRTVEPMIDPDPWPAALVELVRSTS